TFTVSGTVDAGVESVTLTNSSDADTTYTGEISGETVTFSGVPAGTYTVSATYGDDYKAVTVIYTDTANNVVTVSDADVSDAFTVTSTAKVSSAVTVADTENGTVTIKSGSTTLDATALASVVEGTELTVSTVPNGGYELSKIEVTPTNVDSETTIDVDENGTFEMPAEAVTVTVTFTERTYSDGKLMAATYISRYGTDDTEGAVTLDANSNYSTTGEILAGNPGNYARVGLMKFNATVDEEDAAPIYSATLKLTQKEIDSRLDNGFNVSSVTGDYDASTITFVDVYGTDCIADASKAAIQEDSPISAFTEIIQIGKNPANTSGENLASAEDGVEYSIDVTDYVKSVKEAEGTVYSLALNNSRRGMTFYGYSSTHEPVLEITRGINTTFTVVSASNEETKVAGAAIVVKSGDDTVATATTGEDGTATVVLLPSTEYTYTVTSADYAIKSDTLTTGTEAGTKDVALSDNVAATIAITDPTDGTTVAAGDTTGITYTATVYDQDGRAMTGQTIDWSVTNEGSAVENVTITDGKVTAEEEAEAGTYTVNATVSGTEVTTTSYVTVSKAAKVAVSITSADDDMGSVSYTVNGTASTDTEVLPGKTIVATATANALYGFVGWATSADNVTTGTYVSTEAEYEYTLQEGEALTLIAVFKYTGIFYSEDFEGFAVGSDDAQLSNWTHTNGLVRIMTSVSDTANVSNALNWYVNAANAARTNTHTINSTGYVDDNGKVTFSVDIRYAGDSVSNASKSSRSFLGILDSSDNVVFGISWGTKTSDPTTMSLGVSDNSKSDNYDIEMPTITSGNAAEITSLANYDTNTSKWFNLEVTLDTSSTEDNVTVTITPLTSTDSIAGGEAGVAYTQTFSSTATNIAKIKTTLGSMYAGVLLDNIEISAVESEADSE
ncbi:MAG: hypothetical protein LUD03_00865, partial [Firmicutes bacterium]|nr:hypothetical protein [Bacillota bacterium]